MDTTLGTTQLEDQYDQLDYLPYEEEPNYVRAQRVWTYCSPVILLLGTIGNILSLLVILRKSLRSHTTGLYLVVLAVVDTLALYTGLLRYWVIALSGTDVRDLSLAGCKFHRFLTYVLQMVEPWILVSITAERLAAIFVPLKAKSIFTKKFAAIHLSITAVIVVGINAHLLWISTIDDYGVCTIELRYYEFLLSTWGWMDFSLTSLVPFAIMITSNIAIIGRLAYLRHMREKKLNAKEDGAKMTSMTAILLAISFTFFLTTAPASIFLSTQEIWYNRAQSNADFARLDLVWASVIIVSYLNNSVNFLLYCLNGQKFRVELLRMFHCAKVVKVTPTST